MRRLLQSLPSLSLSLLSARCCSCPLRVPCLQHCGVFRTATALLKHPSLLPRIQEEQCLIFVTYCHIFLSQKRLLCSLWT